MTHPWVINADSQRLGALLNRLHCSQPDEAPQHLRDIRLPSSNARKNALSKLAAIMPATQQCLHHSKTPM
jgi:hypothetical protein